MVDADTPDARDDEDVIVNLADEPVVDADKDKGKTEAKLAPVPGPGKVVAPVDGLKDLQNQIEAERGRAARAEEIARTVGTERDRAVAFAQEAQRRGLSAQELAIDNKITNATNEIDRITEQLESAYNEGDFKKVSNLQRDMGKIAGDLAVFKRDKEYAASQIARHKQQQPQTRQPAEPEPIDPFEMALKNRSPAVQDFLRKHRELVRGDGTLKRAAIDAHEKALDAGMRNESPEYFAHVEATLKGASEQQKEHGSTEGGYSAAPERGEPLGRQPVNGVQLNASGEFKMTPKYRRLAAEQGVTDVEWARNYNRLLKEGRMQPIPPT